uniref:Uncharacterized protein n=1 Tax=Lepeophtheirus salmonis TaxID=72036 RepID=A0A0K2T9R7_LEPSM
MTIRQNRLFRFMSDITLKTLRIIVIVRIVFVSKKSLS